MILSCIFVIFDQIDCVIVIFYGVIWWYEVLGLVFVVYIIDWFVYEVKIVVFWCNVILYECGYDGSLMCVYLQVGNVQVWYFFDWLVLFDEILCCLLFDDVVWVWLVLVYCIGVGLCMGVEGMYCDVVMFLVL